jgi:hypothetical protein
VREAHTHTRRKDGKDERKREKIWKEKPHLSPGVILKIFNYFSGAENVRKKVHEKMIKSHTNLCNKKLPSERERERG